MLSDTDLNDNIAYFCKFCRISDKISVIPDFEEDMFSII